MIKKYKNKAIMPEDMKNKNKKPKHIIRKNNKTHNNNKNN